MKALQVKRNSLRSLWRRSLVFFSIIALAFTFVACNRPIDPPPNGNENGGLPPPPPPARYVVGMSVARDPQVMSFEALPPDLTGIHVALTWNDGIIEVTEDVTQFTTYPAILTRDNVAAHFVGAPVTAGTWNAIPGNAGHVSEISIRHVTNPTLTRDVWLPLVRPLVIGHTAVNTTEASTVNRQQIHLTGRLTQQDWFEDDSLNLAGVRVEGVYQPVDLSALAGVSVRGNVTWPPAAIRANLPETRRDIPISTAYLDLERGGPTNVGGFQTNPSDVEQPFGRGILLNISGAEIKLGITNFWPISHIEIETFSDANLSPFFQFHTGGGIDWENELFGNGGLTLRVHYNGTPETRVITRDKFRSFQALGTAGIRTPNLDTLEIDNVIAQVWYFGARGAPHAPGAGVDPWLNRSVDVVIPVFEFEGLNFVRKPTEVNVPSIIWGHDSTAFDTNQIPNRLVEAIFRTYDLVAVFTGGRTLAINYLIGTVTNGVFTHWTFADAINGIFDVDPNFLVNTGDEIEEVEINIRIPAATVTGFWTTAAGAGANARPGNNLRWNSLDPAGVRIDNDDFIGIIGNEVADTEITIRVLPESAR